MIVSKASIVLSSIKHLTGLQQRLSAGVAASIPQPSISNQTTIGLKKNVPSLVIFDKDGTILCFHTMWIPWTKYVSQSVENSTGLSLYKEIAKVLGLCTMENKVKPGLLAEGTMHQITIEISSILSKRGISEQEARKIASDSLKYSNEKTLECQLVKELSDTSILFDRLKYHGTKIAVCTADNRKSSLAALNRLKLLPFIDMIVCGDDKNALPKPDPHNALRICDHLSVEPSEAIMVGDTRVDIEMAHAAKLGSAVGVLSGVGCRDHLHKADILIDHIGDLIEVFYEK